MAVEFYLNNELIRINNEEAFYPVSTFLRRVKGMTATKVVCEEGDCGACTVLLGRLNLEGKIEYKMLDSCIYFTYQLHKSHVVSVEGLTNNKGLHPIQESIVNNFASQCGFCTPGFVMAMAGMFEEDKAITEDFVRQKLTGNLCRCTGYTSIIEAALKLNDIKPKVTDYYNQEEIANSLLKISNEVKISIDYHSEIKNVFIPKDVAGALKAKQDKPEYTLVMGATDLGVQSNKRKLLPANMLLLGHLEELAEIKIENNNISIGAGVTWSALSRFFERDYEFSKILDVFASEQIRNVATLVGNVANASPIGDSLPWLFVSEAILVLASVAGERQVNINNFYSGYKQFDLANNEIISRVLIPRKQDSEIVKLYKISKRKDLDISIFTAAFKLNLDARNKIEEISIAYGGVGPVVLRLVKTEEFLTGKQMNEENMIAAGEIAITEITPISDVRAGKEYRLQLAKNILLKLHNEIQNVEEVIHV